MNTHRAAGAARALLLALIFTLVLIAGCGSTIKETYYLKAYDPSSDASNFFRIRVTGQTTSSKTKFSVGFFDRTAVERLFGENLLSREHMGTQVDVFSSTGDYNTDLEARLQRAETAGDAAAADELRLVAATLSANLASMQFRLSLEGTQYQTVISKLTEAATWVADAETKLKTIPPNVNEIASARIQLAKAMGTIRAARVAVDGQVIVRFLDGAGNEVDVSNQVQLIFVSTDSGRFTQALRDLVQSDKTRQELLQVVLGPKIVEAERVKARLTANTAANTARLGALVERKKEVDAATTSAEITAALTRAANDVAGAVTLGDAGDIRVFVEGL